MPQPAFSLWTVLTATDRARLEDLYPPLRTLAEQVAAKAQARLDGVEPGRWRVRVFETSRSRSAQLSAKATGHSNAGPDKAPHCVTRKDGGPAAMACDFWIVDAVSGTLAPDGAIVWSVIPCAAYEVSPLALASGAFFVIGGGDGEQARGDWPHIELRGWQKLVDAGVLLGG